jgi:hypothetical protein
MKLQSKIANSVGLVLLLTSVSFAQHVRTDYDRKANFGQHKDLFLGQGSNARPALGRPDQGGGERRSRRKGLDGGAVGR